MKHVVGRIHSAANALSWRPRTASDNIDNLHKRDYKDIINIALYTTYTTRIETKETTLGTFEELVRERVDSTYSNFHRDVIYYLLTLRRPLNVNKNIWHTLRKGRLVTLSGNDSSSTRSGLANPSVVL